MKKFLFSLLFLPFFSGCFGFFDSEKTQEKNISSAPKDEIPYVPAVYPQTAPSQETSPNNAQNTPMEDPLEAILKK